MSAKGNQELAGVRAACDKHDIEYMPLTPAEVKDRFPGVTLPDGHEAIYSGEGGVVNATKACAMFQELARKRGATLLDEVEVVAIAELAYGVEIRAANGRMFRGKKVVICPGAWCSKFLRKTLGLVVETRVLKTTVAYWRTGDPSFAAAGGMPVFINYSDKAGDDDDIYGLPILEYPGPTHTHTHTHMHPLTLSLP